MTTVIAPPAPGTEAPGSRVVFSLARHELYYRMIRYSRTWRGTVVISLVNPLLFLIGIGVGLGKVVQPHPAGLQAAGYLAFFAPGMLAASSMQNGIVESAYPVTIATTKGGSYRVAVATPLSSTEILIGHAVYMAMRIAMSAAAFLIVMAAFGAQQSALVVLAVPAALLTGMAFAMPTAAWAVTLERPDTLFAIFKWVVMPLYLFSGTFFPISHMPLALRLLAYVTPLWHGVDLCRSLSLGTLTWGSALLHVGYLGALCVVGFLLATRTYRRRLYV
jgi:lipooligosaccharide transport system permease protein